MTGSLSLLGKRRFLPLFATQFLNAFNDNFYKMAMVILVTYTIYRDPTQEAFFNALAGALFILPFFLFSALAGQLADSGDKARIIRIIKSAEILIMLVGATGIYFQIIPVMLAALFAMGVHSTFFGPIKYAILPQHLPDDEVLAGTGWVEAGTYIAILMGTIVGGLLPAHVSMFGILVVSLIGRVTAIYVPDAPPEREAVGLRVDYNILTSSWRLVRATMHIRHLFLAIISISFFWAIGAILAAQFPPLVKNALNADNTVATMFTAVFSIGVAIGSVVVNRLLKGTVSARYSPASVMAMALFVLLLWYEVGIWVPVADTPADADALLNWHEFLAIRTGDLILLALLGIAIFGGMFVVPLYAFLTTTVAKSETARTVAANNIVNSGFMVAAAVLLSLLIALGLTIQDTLLMVAVACLISAWIAWQLHKACD
ncbi:MAG: MFS transporter [Sphingopyxis sp.]|nr:MFS transporter [Sphingopyxis sp.]